MFPPPKAYALPCIRVTLSWLRRNIMFEQTDFAVVMALLALAGVALMADEKLETTCLRMMTWIKLRGRP
jgi:hypothetical protein